MSHVWYWCKLYNVHALCCALTLKMYCVPWCAAPKLSQSARVWTKFILFVHTKCRRTWTCDNPSSPCRRQSTRFLASDVAIKVSRHLYDNTQVSYCTWKQYQVSRYQYNTQYFSLANLKTLPQGPPLSPPYSPTHPGMSCRIRVLHDHEAFPGLST